MHYRFGVLQSNVHRLQRLHNWSVRITAQFYHVSEHHANFNWLTVSSLLKYCCLFVLQKVYIGDGAVPASPVVFGTNHGYNTRSMICVLQTVISQETV